jgi:hypothetical protein
VTLVPEDTDEITAVVESPAAVEDEPTQPGVRAPQVGRIRLPRAGVDEVDQALADLEAALNQLSTQEVRLMAVAGAAFVSLFLPWFYVVEHGARMPPTALLGLDQTPTSALLSIGLIAAILARPRVDQLLPGGGGWLGRGTTILLVALIAQGLARSPSELFPSSYSLAAVVPVGVTVALVLGLLGRLPPIGRWRR